MLVFNPDVIPGVQGVVYPRNYWYQPTYEWASDVSFDVFAYVFPAFGVLASGGNSVQQITIQADSDFECRRLVYAGTMSSDPLVTLMLTDTGSGRNLFSSPAPLGSVCTPDSSSQIVPADMVWPKIFARNATVVATLNNASAEPTTDAVLVMLGRKIYQFAS